jgi:hypothetical protein
LTNQKPRKTNHAAKNVGSDTGSELATHVVEKGDPLLTLANGLNNK